MSIAFLVLATIAQDRRIEWRTDLKAAIEEAKQSKKSIILRFIMPT